MSRKNIFELINSRRNMIEELERINKLLHSHDGVKIPDKNFYDIDGQCEKYSIINYINTFLFKSWKQRGVCINCGDMSNTLGIDMALYEKDESEEFGLLYCEYAANLLYLLRQKSRHIMTETVDAAEQNIKMYLDWINYECKYYPDEEKVLVVSKNAAATAVCEIIDENLAYSVVEYNHFTLKGDIDKKKAILLSLGLDLEPQREVIKKLNPTLEKNIFLMLNNLNLRHNNRQVGDKNYHAFVAKMKKVTLEKWYDELYQLILIAYLLLENEERNQKIKELIDNINNN